VDLAAELDAVPGTVSVWCARLGEALPHHARHEHVPHYAASTMKVAVLVAAYRAHEAGALDLDVPVGVHDRFGSAVGGDFVLRHAPDDDAEVWARLGGTAPLRWLAERMIVTSSNLAANLVLEHVGVPAAHAVWALAGARHSAIGRGIEDTPARSAGVTNTVTAYDLAALLSGIALDQLAGPESGGRMRAVLCATRHRADIAAGLPAGTRIAHKSGWVTGVRHGAGVVYPAGSRPYLLVVCATTALPDRAARRLLARVAAASWTDLGSADISPTQHGESAGRQQHGDGGQP
jgi:beta-lactamase class A